MMWWELIMSETGVPNLVRHDDFDIYLNFWKISILTFLTIANTHLLVAVGMLIANLKYSYPDICTNTPNITDLTKIYKVHFFLCHPIQCVRSMISIFPMEEVKVISSSWKFMNEYHLFSDLEGIWNYDCLRFFIACHHDFICLLVTSIVFIVHRFDCRPQRNYLMKMPSLTCMLL